MKGGLFVWEKGMVNGSRKSAALQNVFCCPAEGYLLPSRRKSAAQQIRKSKPQISVCSFHRIYADYQDFIFFFETMKNKIGMRW